MPGSHFGDELAAAVRRTGNPVVVGLDPRWEQLPQQLRGSGSDSWSAKASAYLQFCNEIVEVVAPLVPAVKPQAAFFEELGPAGMAALAQVIAHARDRGLMVILDGKRNDIGSTAEAYARGYLGRNKSAWGADALTVSPYLGDDSLSPFVNVAAERGAGLFVLVKTSNPGGRMLQDAIVGTGDSGLGTGDRQGINVPGLQPPAPGVPLYRRVAAHVEQLATKTAGATGYGIVGAVVGATYPQQLAELRAAMPHTWFLVPGYGSQGGTAADVAVGFDANGLGAIVNNSRGIIFAYERKQYAEKFGHARWQEAVEAATRDMITELQQEIPALRHG